MISFFLAWFSVMFTLVFSPGPANILLAAAGARQGFTKSIPVVLGIDLVFVVKSFLLGFGFIEVIERYPMILTIMQIIGVIYLLWLSKVFIKYKPGEDQNLGLKIGFKKAVVLQTINVKGWIMVALMFSLFSTPASELWGSYSTLTLIVMLTALNVVVHIFWVIIGATIGHFNTSLRFEKIMNMVFAAALAITAIWLAWSTL